MATSRTIILRKPDISTLSGIPKIPDSKDYGLQIRMEVDSEVIFVGLSFEEY